jgi:DNA-directed RNA polymerase specialized sigma24 family protein
MLRIRFVNRDGEEEDREERRVEFNSMPWDGPIKGYAINFIEHVAWMFANRCEPDDLLQEAWVVYWKVSEAYPHISKRKHFMALFKSALRNHFINYNRKLKRFPDVVSLADGGDGEGGDSSEMLPPVTDGLAAAEQRLFRDFAPEPVRNVIKQLCEGELPLRYEWRDGVRETTNEFLARVAGVPASTPVVEMVLQYVDGQTPKEIKS